MKQALLLCLTAAGLGANSSSAVPLHLEYSFAPTGPSDVRSMRLRAYELVNGAYHEFPEAFPSPYSASWSAFAVVDIADDYSTVTFQSFSYSQAGFSGGISDTFNLGFFGSSPYEIQVSSIAFELTAETVPLHLDGSFDTIYADPAIYSVAGQSTILGESEPFSFPSDAGARPPDPRFRSLAGFSFRGRFLPSADLSLIALELDYLSMITPEPSLGSGIFGTFNLELRTMMESADAFPMRAVASTVPEPSTLLLVGSSLGSLGLRQRIRRSKPLAP